MGGKSRSAKKKMSFGTCSFEKTSPQQQDLSPDTSVLNVILPFEEALKLNLAVEECLRQLNRYKRSTREGRRTALNLAVFLDQEKVTVMEGRLSQ